MRARRGRLAVLVACALVAACVALPPPGPRLAGAAPDRGAAPNGSGTVRALPPDAWRASRRVPVRLADQERGDVLFAHFDDAVYRVARAGGGVSLDGGPSRPFVVLEPDGRELAIDGRRYGVSAAAAFPHPVHGLRVEAWVELETYVSGVVASELVLWNAEPALLEAQAIAARSYAVGTLERRARDGRAYLWDGVEDQAFRGRFVADAAARGRGLDARLDAAIERTRGQVLVFGGRAADVRFHAACGGHTALAADVFGPGVPGGARTSSCPGCAVAPGWSRDLDADQLAGAARALGLERFGTPAPTRRDPSGRWLEVELRSARGVRPLSANELREALGWTTVPSAWITGWTPRADGGALVTGRGRGHGVGLCQEGAAYLAGRGVDAARILGHYYPGAHLAQL